AADDAAGLQISERMTSQVQGLNQAVRNANDAISLTQTAEGALGEVTSSLQRMRQLSVQSQNGINSEADREALDKEFQSLGEEIDRVAGTTQFGDKKLLDGSLTANFLVGATGSAGERIDVDLTTTSFSVGAGGLGVTGDITTSATAATALTAIDAALSTVGTQRAELGATQNRFQSTIRNLSNISENVSAARSQIRDTDFATETAELTRNQIMQQAGLTILSQANQSSQAALSLLG
ncbi:MAG: flagellin, partial [Paraglaciecola sp.]